MTALALFDHERLHRRAEIFFDVASKLLNELSQGRLIKDVWKDNFTNPIVIVKGDFEGSVQLGNWLKVTELMMREVPIPK